MTTDHRPSDREAFPVTADRGAPIVDLTTAPNPGDPRFRIVFQPIFDLRQNRAVGYEALTRFDDGESITVRLEEADQLGTRPELELTLVGAALEHTPYFDDDTWISVNISPSVLLEHGASLAEALGRSNVPVMIELTENEPIHDYRSVRQSFGLLPPATKLCVDDVGTGYAYLHSIIRLQADCIKLDQGWAAKVQTDPIAQQLLVALIDVCQQDGITVIAEGIETSPQQTALEALGVIYGQGYLLGHPEPHPVERLVRS